MTKYNKTIMLLHYEYLCLETKQHFLHSYRNDFYFLSESIVNSANSKNDIYLINDLFEMSSIFIEESYW